MNRSYTTRTEAIHREIVEPIEAGDATAAEFDIETIADLVLSDDNRKGYRLAEEVGPEDFWAIVMSHALTEEEIAEQHEADRIAEHEDGHEADMAQVDDSGRTTSHRFCDYCGAWLDYWGDHRRAGCPAEKLPIGATVHYLGQLQTVVARTDTYRAGPFDVVTLVLDVENGWPKPVEVEAGKLIRRA